MSDMVSLAITIGINSSGATVAQIISAAVCVLARAAAGADAAACRISPFCVPPTATRLSRAANRMS
jgi:hypothetical protein